MRTLVFAFFKTATYVCRHGEFSQRHFKSVAFDSNRQNVYIFFGLANDSSNLICTKNVKYVITTISICVNENRKNNKNKKTNCEED